MNDTSNNSGSGPGSTPLEVLFTRLREAAGELAPEPLLDRMRPVFDGFFEQFQLVPRRDYDAHLTTLTRLEEKVSRLEERITELESDD